MRIYPFYLRKRLGIYFKNDAFFMCSRDSFWPGGVLAESSPDRKKDVKVRTRVAAKTKMFGSIPGNLISLQSLL